MIDHFARLGLPRRFAVDAAELERQYLARSRATHPDHHASGASAELAASVGLSAELNEAYRVLRDPFARAEHLLALSGGPSAADRKEMPPAFLMEMLEAREQVEEVLAENPPCDARKVELLAGFQSRYDELFAEVAENFAKPTPDLNAVREHLNAAKYVKGLLRDLDG